jgi:hypothetical protein
MAQVIAELPPRAIGRNGRAVRKYPWAEWADGQVWAVLHGEDYQCKHKSFILACRRHGWEAGLRFDYRHLMEADEQIGWAIQFVDDGRQPRQTGRRP